MMQLRLAGSTIVRFARKTDTCVSKRVVGYTRCCQPRCMCELGTTGVSVRAICTYMRNKDIGLSFTTLKICFVIKTALLASRSPTCQLHLRARLVMAHIISGQ